MASSRRGGGGSRVRGPLPRGGTEMHDLALLQARRLLHRGGPVTPAARCAPMPLEGGMVLFSQQPPGGNGRGSPPPA